ncbi:MAG: hypothetical protein H7145_04190 [Akkermansiaceae bacterium]|nr:hypothetical protein [Armatimonadota bacterium]
MRLITGLTIGASAVAVFVAGVVFAQATKTLYMNGKAVSSGLLVKDGVVYVPVTDIAKSLGMSVIPKADGFEIVPQDGAKKTSATKAVKGLSGAVGETLGNGQVTIQVLQVVRGDRYVSTITGETFAAEPDSDLVAVICRIRNTLKKPRQYDLGYFKGGNTALIGADGKSFAPKRWDRKEPIPRLPAGAGADFAVIFAVPKGAELGEFVYAVRPNDFDRSMRQDDFHVSLALKKDTESTTKQR